MAGCGTIQKNADVTNWVLTFLGTAYANIYPNVTPATKLSAPPIAGAGLNNDNIETLCDHLTDIFSNSCNVELDLAQFSQSSLVSDLISAIATALKLPATPAGADAAH